MFYMFWTYFSKHHGRVLCSSQLLMLHSSRFCAAIQVATAPFVAPNASSLVLSPPIWGRLAWQVWHQVWHQVFAFLDIPCFFRKKYNDDWLLDDRIVILIWSKKVAAVCLFVYESSDKTLCFFDSNLNSCHNNNLRLDPWCIGHWGNFINKPLGWERHRGS